MVRVFWMVLIVGVTVSLIWWPGMRNEVYIFALIEKERIWQSQNLGVDLVQMIDGGMRIIQVGWVNPIPHGSESSIFTTIGMAEEETVAATGRMGETPYFQAFFALLLLTLGRLCTTVVLSVLLLPLLGACWIDGLTQREVRLAKFKNPESFHFRVAWVLMFALFELMIFMSLMPIWIHPMWILMSECLLGLLIFVLALNLYKS